MTYGEIFLKKNEERRLSKGHQWVFSNEVDPKRSPLDAFTAGDLVTVIANNGKIIGTAYINPHTLICARLLSRSSGLVCDRQFFKQRLATALALREKIFNKPYYRLIYGESDGLPGVVIDRFGSVLSVQIATVGIDLRKEDLIAALIELFSPTAIVLKNDSGQRSLEGLPSESEVSYGQLPENLIIEENGAQFKVDILGGQKTGWFYDHRFSRAQLANYANNAKILDLFSYTGAWAIPATLAGAAHTTCVDASEGALQLAQHNAHLNGVQDKMNFVRADVFDFLKQARDNKAVYDIIVLDPPALIKRKKDFKQGFEAYRRLNQLALQSLAINGVLISASCSFHLSADNLREIVLSAARQTNRHLTFFYCGGQAGDHPIDPAIPETEYLKTFFCSVSASL